MCIAWPCRVPDPLRSCLPFTGPEIPAVQCVADSFGGQPFAALTYTATACPLLVLAPDQTNFVSSSFHSSCKKLAYHHPAELMRLGCLSQVHPTFGTVGHLVCGLCGWRCPAAACDHSASIAVWRFMGIRLPGSEFHVCPGAAASHTAASAFWGCIGVPLSCIAAHRQPLPSRPASVKSLTPAGPRQRWTTDLCRMGQCWHIQANEWHVVQAITMGCTRACPSDLLMYFC